MQYNAHTSQMYSSSEKNLSPLTNKIQVMTFLLQANWNCQVFYGPSAKGSFCQSGTGVESAFSEWANQAGGASWNHLPTFNWHQFDRQHCLRIQSMQKKLLPLFFRYSPSFYYWDRVTLCYRATINYWFSHWQLGGLKKADGNGDWGISKRVLVTWTFHSLLSSTDTVLLNIVSKVTLYQK